LLKSLIVRRIKNFPWYIIFALLLVVVACCLGLFIDLTGDAGKYGAIARHVFESGDLINLKVHGAPYDQKPPLLFWLAALGFKIGGLQNWSYKLFPVLYSIAGLWFTYKLGENLYDKKTGRLATVLLATSWAYFMFTMDVHTDLVLQANVTLAMWQLSAYLKRKKTLNFILTFVAIGLAMLTKGPIGGAIPAFALATHLCMKKDFKQLLHPKWILGVIIALSVTFPAFIGLYNQFGTEGIKFFFITNNLGRITGSYVGNNTDYFFYFHSILYLLLPWTLLFLFAFYHEFKSLFKSNQENREYLTIGGIWVFFLILSIARGKAPHYVFVLVPMMLVITAKWIGRFMDGKHKTLRRLIRSQVFICLFLLLFFLLLGIWIFPYHQSVWWLLLLFSIGFSVYVLTGRKVSAQTRLLFPSIIMMSTLMLFLNAHVLPAAFKYQAAPRASCLYNKETAGDDPFYNYLYPYFEVFFYSKSEVKQLYSIKNFKLEPGKTAWIFTTQTGKDTICADYSEKIEKIYPYLNQGMSRMRPVFLNPATRQQALDSLFLIKLQTAEHK